MTREEAMKLRVGKDIAFIVEPKLEEIFEIAVTGINIDIGCKLDSALFVTGHCEALLSTRRYAVRELWATEIEALQKLAEIYTLRSDQNLNKRHAVCEKIAKLKGGRDET